MFKMIRCGTGFNLVILVSPPDAGPDTPDAKYYRCASWKIGEHQPDVFNEINRDGAISYFSGIADSIGYEEPPANTFPTLESALQYVTAKRTEHYKKLFQELGINPDKRE